MSIDSELQQFYAKHGFGQEVGARPKTVGVFTGCLLVPMPNIEARRKYLKYHDLHHLVNGFSVGRIGEGKVSAWELGAGSFRVSPLLGTMNLIALSTGLFLRPKEMLACFELGCQNKLAYSKSMRSRVDGNEWESVAALREHIASNPPKKASWLRYSEFGLYCITTLGIHACVAIPAMVLRIAADKALGMTLFEAVKAKPRSDLF